MTSSSSWHLFPLLFGVDVSYETPPFNLTIFSDKSFLMLSNHLHFGLPLLLFPGTSIPISLLPTYLSSLLNTCPYHFNLLSCTFLDISPTFVVPLILSFLIMSSLVTPLIHPNFHHIQLLLLCFLHCPCLGSVHHSDLPTLSPYLLRFGGSQYAVTALLQIIRQRVVAVKKILHNYTADGATGACLDLPSRWRTDSWAWCYHRHLYFMSDMGKWSFIRCYPDVSGRLLVTCLTVIGGENIRKERAAASGHCETAHVVCA